MPADTKQILAAIRALRAQLDTFETTLQADPIPGPLGHVSLTGAVRTLLAEQPNITATDAIARLAPLGYNVASIKSSVSRLRSK